MNWTLDEAQKLCILVENAVRPANAHVALTGGVLYKDGARKDLDLLFYGVRQTYGVDPAILLPALEKLGFEIGEQYGWVTKAYYQSKPVDLFFPELYPPSPEQTNHYGV